jgi:vancomycin resistance protein YoaR
MFRTALASGLPITERRNHSYRVSYYEPAGTDATIYSPRPDLKFKNDTNNNILIQARFEGTNDMYFDFWGTSDGRTATTTYPVIYNIVSPGPTQIIETTELPVGEKKCTERAHSGAEAYFDYTVVYNPNSAEENKVETRFQSKYVPWREVCLVGVEKIEEEISDDNIIIVE